MLLMTAPGHRRQAARAPAPYPPACGGFAARPGRRESAGALGVSVDTVADGSQALQALLERPYSVLISDLKMPNVTGMQLIEEIQARRLPVTVIVTTGYGSIDEAVKAMRLGAYDFLTKPPDPQHLCLILQRALRERTLLDEVAN